MDGWGERVREGKGSGFGVWEGPLRFVECAL